MSAPYLGDLKETQTLNFKWNTNAVAGESITRATNGTVKVYPDDSTTEITAGITDVEDHDANTGVHNVKIDLNASASYAKHKDYSVIIDATTIDGKVINATIAHFSIENRQNSALMRHIVPSGFDERSSLTSQQITRAGHPDYGVHYTADSGTPTKDDFDGNILVGAMIGPKSGQSGQFMIVGGYFFDDSDDTTRSVFGIALDSARFGITEGGSVFLNTNWTSAGVEAANGNGWTFIVIDADETYSTTGALLEIWINPSFLRGAFISENSAGVTCPTVVQIVDGVWDELKSAHTVANSFGDFLDIEISSRSDFDETTDPVELLDTGGSVGTSADELVDDVWEELLSGHVTAATFGKQVNDLLTDANYKDFETQITVNTTQSATPEKIPKIYTRGTAGNLKTITVTVDGDDVVNTEIGL